MKIIESKNLKYTKIPFGYFEGLTQVAPEKCILEKYSSYNDRLELNFKNGASAFIAAKNPQGGLELDKIEEKVVDFIDKSYEEILNADF